MPHEPRDSRTRARLAAVGDESNRGKTSRENSLNLHLETILGIFRLRLSRGAPAAFAEDDRGWGSDHAKPAITSDAIVPCWKRYTKPSSMIDPFGA